MRMAPLPESDSITVRSTLSPFGPLAAVRGDCLAPPSRRLFALLAASALVLLHAANPTAWADFHGPWAPAAGLGLVLIAWFGPRAGWLVLAAGLTAALQALLVVALFPGTFDTYPPILAFGDALLGTAEVLAAWWAYRRLGGARALGDPRSAVVFILIVPGAAAAAFAGARAGLACAATARWFDFGSLMAQTWLSQSLGLLTLAPPLLTAATPWLVRRGLVRPEVVSEKPTTAVGHAGADRLTRGDAVEIAGLALGAGLLALVLVCTYGRQVLEGWQPWGAPLLLVVWASLRQGQRGGVLTASLAAALPLCFLTPLSALPPPYALLIQGNLLALVGAGLLAAAAAGWLRINEMRYRQVVTHVPAVVYSGRILAGDRPATEVTLVSDASCALLGCPPEQLLGDHRRWLDRVYPDDREVVRAALAQLNRQKEPVVCEYRLASPADAADKGGESRTPVGPRWVRDVLAPHFDAEGRLSGWDGVVTEVTEQRAMAADLRRTTSMFQALVANLPAGVFFVQGPTGHPILVNNRARQLLGRREEPAAGLERLSQAYHLHRSDGSPYPVEELPVFQALRRGVTAMRDDIVVHQADGRRVPLVTWAAPVRLDGRGPTDAAVWVLEDLTALHKAEAARRDTEGRLRTVVETMGEGLIVQDRNQAVVDCNAAACALFRRTPEQMRASPLARFLVLPARGRLGPARRGASGPGGAAHGPAGAELHAGSAAGRGRPWAALAPRQRHAADRRRRHGRRGDDPVRRHGLPPRPGGFAPVGGEISRADRGDAADAGAGRPRDARRVRQPGRPRRNWIRDGGNRRAVGVGALHPPGRPAARSGRRGRGPRRPAEPHGIPL